MDGGVPGADAGGEGGPWLMTPSDQAQTTAPPRTAKACGPDAARGINPRSPPFKSEREELIGDGDEKTETVRRGEHDISR
jgi:hypothetical protein